MGMTTPSNAAPLTYALGTQDLSTREQVVEAEALPTHLPKVYIYAAKGPTTPHLVSGADRVRHYGDASFDLRREFTTHQTVLSNLLTAEGNAHMIERVLPADIGPRANFLLSLDVLSTTVTQYKRNADGSIMLNASTGLPDPVLPLTTLPGYKAKWVVTRIDTLAGEEDFGAATQVAGDQSSGGTQSTRWPILQFWASSYGSVFNNSGIKLWAPTEASTNVVNAKAMEGSNAYPFRLSVVSRATASSTARAVESQNGEQFIEFVLKPDTINTFTDAQISLHDLFLPSYTNTESNGLPLDYGHFGGMKVYDNNIATLIAMFYAAEEAHAGAFSDFDGSDGEEWKFNFLTGVSSKNAPYFTYQLDNVAANATRLGENTVIYAGGADDGTVDESLFAGLVTTAVSEYGNLNSPLQDDVSYPESIIYDTGFPLATKRALCKFISERKDTFVVLSTATVGVEMSASEESSVAVALKAYAQAYPESDYFGTGTMRALLLRGYGKLKGSQYKNKLPVTLELAVKAARMMGASNGKWSDTQVFDRAPNNNLTMFEKLNNVYTPATSRIKDWALGLNWVQKFDRDSYFFPALQTVTEDDSSVLNSFFAVMACVELQKVCQRTHRTFSGSVRLSDAQLIERINKDVEERTTGRFASMFKIVPNAMMTSADTARGYSWRIPVSIYANNAKTVSTVSIHAYRMSDYVGV